MPSSAPVSQARSWIVVGGGLTGLIAAWKLSGASHTVTLIEAGRGLGGVNQSFDWEGHQIDLGCHFIGNDDDATTALFLEMLGREPLPVSPRLASWNSGALSQDVEYPDFTAHPASANMLQGLIEAAAQDTPVHTRMALSDYLAARYGQAAQDGLAQALRKMLGRSIDGVSAECAPALPIRRLLVCSSAAAALLKKTPALDDRILQPWGGNTMRFNADTARHFPARAFYPSDGGMGAFTAATQRGLEARGVDIRVGTSIHELSTDSNTIALTLDDGSTHQANHLIWTAGPGPLSALAGLAPDIDAQIIGVPMVLFYFDVARETAEDTRHYIHDFDPDHLLFRASSPTRWAPHVSPEGRAYLCCEITTQIDSAIWSDPDSHIDRIWAEAVETGMASGPRPDLYRVMKTPVSYKLPATAFEPAMQPLRDWLAKQPRIGFTEPFTFAKTKIAREVDQLISADADLMNV